MLAPWRPGLSMNDDWMRAHSVLLSELLQQLLIARTTSSDRRRSDAGKFDQHLTVLDLILNTM